MHVGVNIAPINTVSSSKNILIYSMHKMVTHLVG